MFHVPRRLMVVVLPVLLLALVAPAPSGVAARAPDEAPVQVSVLPNGLTVATREWPAADTVAVAVAVRAGGRDESPALRGGSHLLEHIHFLGTPRYPSPQALFGAITGVGGDMNASTSTETTSYFSTVPAARFSIALDVLAEMLQRPDFPTAEVERERGVVQEELRGRPRASLSIALDTLGERLIGTAAQDAAGTLDSVAAVARDDLLLYRAQRYAARNMVMAVVGPLHHADVVAAAGAAFAQLPSGERARPAALPPPEESLRLEGSSRFASVVLVGQRIPGLDSPDAAAMVVLDGLLDVPGTRMQDAMQARLNARGGTRIEQFSDVGLWSAFALAPPWAADRVAEVVRDQVRRLQDERVDDDELHAVTRFLAGRMLITGDSITEQAQRLAELSVLGVYQSEENLSERILAVTPEDVQRVARAYLNPDTMSVLAQE